MQYSILLVSFEAELVHRLENCLLQVNVTAVVQPSFGSVLVWLFLG